MLFSIILYLLRDHFPPRIFYSMKWLSRRSPIPLASNARIYCQLVICPLSDYLIDRWFKAIEIIHPINQIFDVYSPDSLSIWASCSCYSDWLSTVYATLYTRWETYTIGLILGWILMDHPGLPFVSSHILKISMATFFHNFSFVSLCTNEVDGAQIVLHKSSHI